MQYYDITAKRNFVVVIYYSFETIIIFEIIQAVPALYIRNVYVICLGK